FRGLQVPVIRFAVRVTRLADELHQFQIRAEFQPDTAQFQCVEALQVTGIAALVVTVPLERLEHEQGNVDPLPAMPCRSLDLRVYPDAAAGRAAKSPDHRKFLIEGRNAEP